MNIGCAIAWKYPNADPTRDYSVVADPNNPDQQSIEFWNLPDPQPTPDELQQWWIGYLKDAKIAELDEKYNETALGGFTSTINGTTYRFNSDEEAARYFLGAAIMFLSNQITTVQWQTADGIDLNLDKDTFLHVFADGFSFVQQNIQKYRSLKQQAEAASTEDQINAITW